MINKQFPSAYDVDQTIKFHYTQYEHVRRYYQSIGLFNIGNGKDHLATYATSLLLEQQDYLNLRQMAQGGNNATYISGFSVKTTLLPKSSDDIREDLISLRRKLIAQEEELKKKDAPVQKLHMPKVQDGVISAKFEYQRTIPGRVELIQKVDTEVDFIVEHVEKQLWRVICFPDANQDIKKIENVFKTLGEKSYEPFIISLEDFSQKQRILFFDTILDHYTQKSEWRFLQVTEISVRQEPEKNYILLDSDELDDDEAIKEAEESDLLSITQAVLQGRGLRTNSFVKKCESQGFYFPSMTLALDNRNTPESIQVNIRFKLSPKMFEVVLTSMSEKSDLGEIPVSFEYRRQQEILRDFWINCHTVWQDLYQQIPLDRKDSQISFADFENP